MTGKDSGPPDSRLLDRAVRRWTAAGTAIAVGAFWMVATLGRPWRLLVDQRILASRFFDIQAERLLHGHLTVPRGSLQIEEFVTPHGSHMYFGIFPAVIRLPFFLFDRTMEGRLTLLSCLVAVAVTSVAAARLARRAQRQLVGSFGDVAASARWYLLIAAAPTVMTPMMYLAARSMVYHEAIAWGVAGALWAVVAVMQWWDLRRFRDASLAALAACVALNSRPSVGMLPIVMVALLVGVLAVRRSWRAASTGVGIAGAAIVVYCAVNVARFGQLFGAPHHEQVAHQYRPVQQAAVAMTDGSLFSLRFMPTTFLTYFDLWPDGVRLERLFPFAGFGATGSSVDDVPMQMGQSGSLPAAAPVLVVLAVVGAVWVVRRADVAWRSAVAGGVVAALLTLGFWAVWHRYLVDFVPLLVVLSVPGGWMVLIAVRRWSARRRTVLVVTGCAATALAFSVQVGLAVWSGTLLMAPDHDDMAATLRMRYAIDDAFFRGMPPDLSLITLEQTQFLLIMPSPGKVVIAGECDAMYTGEFGWVPFEMRSGGAFRSVVSALPAEMDALRAGPRVVSSGATWSLIADPGDADVPPSLRLMVRGEQVAQGPLVIAGSGVVLDVVADGLLHVLTVTQDGTTVLSQPVEDLVGQTVAPGWDVFEGDPPPTCATLLNRYRQDELRLLSRGR